VIYPDRLLHAAGIVAVLAIPFGQGYFQYRRYRARPNASRATLRSMQALLVFWVILAVLGVLWNILGAFGLVRI